MTRRMTMAQALIEFLKQQHVRRDGAENRFFALDNHGFSSIGGLSRSCGSGGFGTEYRYRRNGGLEGDVIDLDLAANAASLGAWAVRARTRDELLNALSDARGIDRTSVVVIETDINERVPGSSPGGMFRLPRSRN